MEQSDNEFKEAINILKQQGIVYNLNLGIENPEFLQHNHMTGQFNIIPVDEVMQIFQDNYTGNNVESIDPKIIAVELVGIDVVTRIKISEKIKNTFKKI